MYSLKLNSIINNFENYQNINSENYQNINSMSDLNNFIKNGYVLKQHLFSEEEIDNLKKILGKNSAYHNIE